jgi:hypothetical protein
MKDMKSLIQFNDGVLSATLGFAERAVVEKTRQRLSPALFEVMGILLEAYKGAATSESA